MIALYFMIVITMIGWTISLLPLISQMVLYHKKGKHSWGVLVPIYNEILKFKIAGLSPWLVLLYLIPIANIVIGIIANIKFIKSYDKSTGFAVLALFFPVIFYPLTAFPIETKEKADKNVRRVNKVVYAILTILFGGIGINKFYARKIKAGILSLVFSWTLVPTFLSVVEFVEVLTEKADKNGTIPVTSQRKTNTFFASSVVLFVVVVLAAIIPWESLLSNFTMFSDFNTWLNDIKIGNYQIFNAIIGAPSIVDEATGSSSGVIGVIGKWTMNDMAIFLFIITAIIALCNNVKFNEFIEVETKGIKKVLPVAITAMLISIVLVLMVTSGVNITICNFIVRGFNIVTITLATIIGSVFTADFYYFLSTIGPVFTGAIKNTDLYGVVGLLVQNIHYLTMVVAPTSVGLVIGLYYLNVSYGKWMKYIWKVLLVMLLVVIVATIVVYLIVIEKALQAALIAVLAAIMLVVALVLISKNRKK